MKRNYSIDMLRIMACLAVIVIHVISGPLSNYNGTLDTELALFLKKVHVLMNWSVPVFFMITGYCIFGKQVYTYKNCFLHVAKLVITLATVGLFFALLEAFYIHRTVNVSVILSSLQNVVSGKLWDHMWYLYTAIGVYLVLPVLHPFMTSKKENRMILTGLLFFFTVVVPSAETIMTIGIDFPFGGYLFYVCFGGMIAQKDFGKKQTVCIAMSGVIALACIILAPTGTDFGYRSPAVCLLALSIFVLFCGIQLKPDKFLKTVSRCTFGMYLIHPLFINVAVKLLKLDFLSHNPYIKLASLYVVVCIMSFAATYVYLKIYERISYCRFHTDSTIADPPV